jgi:hypothetical protein
MFDFIKLDSFDIEKTKEYSLSIQVSLDGFSFLIVHSSEKKVIAYKNTPLKISNKNLLARRLKEWLEAENLFKKTFNSVFAFIFTENFTLVPDEYSGDNQIENLTTHLFQHDLNNKLIENKIDDLNAKLIFMLPIEVMNVLHLQFNNNVKIIHPVTNLLKYPVESKKRNSAVILTTKKYFYLIITRNTRLILANSFQAEHLNDLVYHVLNTFQQLEIARSETDLYVSGLRNDNSEIEDMLKLYFENISNLKISGLITNPEIINQSPLSLPLFNLIGE